LLLSMHFLMIPPTMSSRICSIRRCTERRA
jgi:hypothetical protein